jgi:hypothetical protein
MPGKRIGRYLAVAALLLAVATVGATAAGATRITVGNLTVDFGFDSAPKALPTDHDVPVEFWGHSNIGTVDGSAPQPVTHVVAEFDKFGHLETRGLPKCSRSRLVATTPTQARRLCPDSIIGTGFGEAVINFPEQAPITAGSPVTFFNGPEIGGDPSLIVHAHLDVPAPTTYLVPVRIERIHKGVYGFRVEATIPPIAGGYGSPTKFRFKVDRDWTFHGKQLSYVYARCPHSEILRARIEADFGPETSLFGTFMDPCRIRQG